MTIAYRDPITTLLHGDCIDKMRAMPDNSIDAIITDPPYGIGFKGKEWDSRKAFDHVGETHNPKNSADAARTRRAEGVKFQAWCEQWAVECLRILKPGGHMVAFGGGRTYHRLTSAIEDAGFEIRDSLHWIYGSGMPKGQDMAKAIDRRRDDREQVLQVTAWLAAARDAAGWTNKRIDALFGTDGRGGRWTTQGKTASVPKLDQWTAIREAIGFDDTEILPLVQRLAARKGQPGDAWSQREVVGQGYRVHRGPMCR